jgi:DNA-binding MarR family transcriptional regulator
VAEGEHVDELVGLISRSLFAAFLRGAEQWARLDVTMPQLKVLMLLGLHGSAPVSQLAQQMSVSPPNVTGILDRLEQHGWVRRTSDAHDRRVVRVVLTDEGRRFLDGIQHASASRTRSRLAEMAPADQDALRQGLRALMSTMVSVPEEEPVLLHSERRERVAV